MNKNLTLLFVFVLTIFCGAQAQQVPNAGLENWNNIILYEDPVSWSSPNQLTSLLGIFPCTKSTDALDGQYAARLEAFFITQFGIVVPGTVGTGTIDATTQTFKGGFPLGGNVPAALIGYYKYAPVNEDSCLMLSVLTKWNTSTNHRDTLAIAYFTDGAEPSYTLFTAPFITLAPGTPDSAIVVVATTNDILTAQAGSVLFIDDIDFTNSVGIQETDAAPLSIYPNPADEFIEFAIPEALQAKTIALCNITAALVKEYPVNEEDLRVNTTNLLPGSYVCLIKNEGGEVIATGKFTVKH
jgi:hypothetical protein